MGECLYCNKEIKNKNPNRKFCSWDCIKIYRRQSRNTLKKCLNCNKDFISSTSNHKFCSIECRNTHNFKISSKENEVNAKYIIYERDHFKCVYCGKSSIEDGAKLHIDHVMPYSLTKDNSLYNLVTSCEDCNISKAIKVLNPDVYKRIINRNIQRNKGISKEKELFAQTVLHEMFEIQKNSKEVKSRTGTRFI